MKIQIKLETKGCSGPSDSIQKDGMMTGWGGDNKPC